MALGVVGFMPGCKLSQPRERTELRERPKDIGGAPPLRDSPALEADDVVRLEGHSLAGGSGPRERSRLGAAPGDATGDQVALG